MQCTPVCGREQMGWEGGKSVLKKDRNGRKGKEGRAVSHRELSHCVIDGVRAGVG
jgi:hypothetical protein